MRLLSRPPGPPFPDRHLVVQSYVGPVSLLSLLFAGLRLDGATYRRVSLEPAATHQCIAVTLLAAIAVGVERARPLGLTPALMVVVEMVRASVALVVESLVLWLIGAKLLSRPVAFAGVLRPLALAGAPGVLYLLVVLTGLVTPLSHVVSFWLLLAFVVGIRAALDTGTLAAIALAAAVWAVESASHGLLERV